MPPGHTIHAVNIPVRQFMAHSERKVLNMGRPEDAAQRPVGTTQFIQNLGQLAPWGLSTREIWARSKLATSKREAVMITLRSLARYPIYRTRVNHPQW